MSIYGTYALICSEIRQYPAFFNKQCASLSLQMTFAVAVNLRAKAFQANQFVEHVKRMHEEKDKGFEEEFKVTT